MKDYRILHAGEIIEQGDEWCGSEGRWTPSKSIGDKVTRLEGRYGDFRRPMAEPVNKSSAMC